MRNHRWLYAVLILAISLSSCEQLTPLGEKIYDRLQLDPPSILAPAADVNGYSNTDIVITLVPADSGDKLLYTIDRSDPADNGITYTGPFTISGHNDPILVKAVARQDGRLDSEVVQAEYLILYDSAEIPVFSPVAGSYTDNLSVTMSSGSAGATIWYTLDGTNPRNSSTRIRYTGSAINVEDDGTPDGSRVVINAVTQVEGLPDSPISTGTYDVAYATLSMPDLSPVSQQTPDPFSVSISSPDGAAIWYTTDGSSPLSGDGALKSPSSNAKLYSTPISINWSGYESRVIKAACFAPGYRPSVARIGSYFKQTGQTPTPEIEIFDPDAPTAITPVSGTVYTNAGAPQARIAAPVTGTRYFYTLDGTMPMISVNGSQIDILTASTQELIVSAELNTSEGGPYDFDLVAVSPGSDPSGLVSASYVVDHTPPSPPVIGYTGLTNGFDSNIYLNAVRWWDQAWTITLSGEGGFEWRFLGDAVATATTASSLFHYNLASKLSSQGSYTLQVRTQDLAGNWSGWQDFEFVRDTVAPVISGSPVYPANWVFGVSPNTTNQFSVQFNEAMEPTSVAMQLLDGASPVVGTVVTSLDDNRRYDLTVPSGLNLDREYSFRLNSATDMAGNPWTGPSLASDFVTGALFWSAENKIYRAPMTSREEYPVQDWYTGPVDVDITEIEVADNYVFWVETDASGNGEMYYTGSKTSSAGAISHITNVIVNPVRDIEIDPVLDRVYFTAPGDLYTIRYRNYAGTTGNGEKLSSEAPDPSGLAWDGSDYYWSDSGFAFYYTGAGPLFDPGGILGGTTNHAIEYRTVGSERYFYGLNTYYLPSIPPSGQSGVSLVRLSLDMQTVIGGSGITVESDLYGEGITYGGDLEIVESGGMNRLYILAPTITGVSTIGGPNEYCGVFSMDLNLGIPNEHYNPDDLSLTRSLNGGLGIDTE